MKSDYSKREVAAIKALKSAIPAGLKKDLVQESKGFFAELYSCSFSPEHYIATTIDGVGTKIILAIAIEKYDTIGIDCVAMNANDLATVPSAKPFLFLDYLACQSKIEEEGITGQIMKGVVSGLEQADCSNILHNSVKLNLAKGETASLDEMIASPKEGHGFDLCGAMLGFVEKEKFNLEVKEGMKIIALQSSGVHSNGLTALRHYLLKGEFEEREDIKKYYKGKHSLDELGEELLKPTTIYSKALASIAKEFPVIGINNTGNGLKNFNRIGQGVEYNINDPIKPQEIFSIMQKESKFLTKKMYETFNMGQGFFILCNTEDADSVLGVAEKFHKTKIVGEVKKGKGKEPRVILETKKEKLEFSGY